jgi:hypothetical protein
MTELFGGIDPQTMAVLALTGLAWGGLLIYIVREILSRKLDALDSRMLRNSDDDAAAKAELQKQINDLRLHVAENYIPRHDFQRELRGLKEDMIRENQYIEEQLSRVHAKLDRIMGGNSNG